jgi:hypothetical protein
MGSKVPGFSACTLSTDDILVFEVHEQGVQARTT